MFEFRSGNTRTPGEIPDRRADCESYRAVDPPLAFQNAGTSLTYPWRHTAGVCVEVPLLLDSRALLCPGTSARSLLLPPVSHPRALKATYVSFVVRTRARKTSSFVLRRASSVFSAVSMVYC